MFSLFPGSYVYSVLCTKCPSSFHSSHQFLFIPEMSDVTSRKSLTRQSGTGAAQPLWHFLTSSVMAPSTPHCIPLLVTALRTHDATSIVAHQVNQPFVTLVPHTQLPVGVLIAPGPIQLLATVSGKGCWFKCSDPWHPCHRLQFLIPDSWNSTSYRGQFGGLISR